MFQSTLPPFRPALHRPPVIFERTTQITAAQLRTASSAPIPLTPAYPGKIIVPVYGLFVGTVTVAFSAAPAASIIWEPSASSAGTLSITLTSVNSKVSQLGQGSLGLGGVNVTGARIMFRLAADVAGGDCTGCKMTLAYVLVDP